MVFKKIANFMAEIAAETLNLGMEFMIANSAVLFPDKCLS
jgi:hypothetical protein